MRVPPYEPGAPCSTRDSGHPDVSVPHCVHPTGHVTLSMPPQQVVQCCYCAQMFGRRYEQVDSPEGHGPYHPARVRV